MLRSGHARNTGVRQQAEEGNSNNYNHANYIYFTYLSVHIHHNPSHSYTKKDTFRLNVFANFESSVQIRERVLVRLGVPC